MPEKFLSELFESAGASQVEYRGRPLFGMFEIFMVLDDFEIELETCVDTPQQGIVLKATDLVMEINGSTMTTAEIWWASAPNIIGVGIERTGDSPSIRIWNQWRSETGVVHAWVLNDAMRVDEIADGFRLRCNSGPGAITFEHQVFVVRSPSLSATVEIPC